MKLIPIEERIRRYKEKVEADKHRKRKYKKDHTEKEWAYHVKRRNRKTWKKYYREVIKKEVHASIEWKEHHRSKARKCIYICDFCGKEFTAVPRYSKKQIKYCSEECAEKGRLKELEDAEIAKRKAIGRKISKLAQERNESYKFKIVITSLQTQTEMIGKYSETSDCYKKFEDMLEENKKVILPRKYVVDKKGEIIESNDEILILKKDGNPEMSKFPNEIGKLIEHKVKSKNGNWVIINKEKWRIEDTFYIPGISRYYNKKWILDKNVLYIMEHIIKNNMDSIELYIYKNEIIVKYSDNNIDIIGTKTKSIITSLYYCIIRLCEEQKLTHVMFMGNIDDSQILCEFFDTLIENKLNKIFIEKKQKNGSKPIQ